MLNVTSKWQCTFEAHAKQLAVVEFHFHLVACAIRNGLEPCEQKKKRSAGRSSFFCPELFLSSEIIEERPKRKLKGLVDYFFGFQPVFGRKNWTDFGLNSGWLILFHWVGHKFQLLLFWREVGGKQPVCEYKSNILLSAVCKLHKIDILFLLN